MISRITTKQKNLPKVNMFIQQSGLCLRLLGYVSIPPKRNRNCMCFGNMQKSIRIKKGNISIVKGQSRHNIIQLQFSKSKDFNYLAQVLSYSQKNKSMYGYTLKIKLLQSQHQTNQILLDTSINSRYRVQSSSKVDKFLKLLFFLI